MDRSLGNSRGHERETSDSGQVQIGLGARTPQRRGGKVGGDIFADLIAAAADAGADMDLSAGGFAAGERADGFEREPRHSRRGAAPARMCSADSQSSPEDRSR